MNELYTTEKKQHTEDVEPGTDFTFRLVVTQQGASFVVVQQDFEDGELCNETPVREFNNSDDAIAFARVNAE